MEAKEREQTVYKIQCPVCESKKMKLGLPCRRCNGKGTIKVEK